MDRDHCSARDVLADIWGPLSPRKRKSIGDSPIKIKVTHFSHTFNFARSLKRLFVDDVFNIPIFNTVIEKFERKMTILYTRGLVIRPDTKSP